MVSIPESVWLTYKACADDFINDNFGINCVLHYPSVKSLCTNCYYDSITNTSTGLYRSGGPVPFSGGYCPYCNGIGFEETTPTDSIKLRVYYRTKDFNSIMPEINIPAGGCMVIGFMSDLAKFERADTIELNSDRSPAGITIYQRTGAVSPHGFKRDRYFTAVLEKAQ